MSFDPGQYRTCAPDDFLVQSLSQSAGGGGGTKRAGDVRTSGSEAEIGCIRYEIKASIDNLKEYLL